MGFDDGTSLILFVLLGPENYAPAFLRLGNSVFIEKYEEDKYTLFDRDGGFSQNLKDGTFNSWGKWAESGSLSFARCMVNCFIEFKNLRKKEQIFQGVT